AAVPASAPGLGAAAPVAARADRAATPRHLPAAAAPSGPLALPGPAAAAAPTRPPAAPAPPAPAPPPRAPVAAAPAPTRAAPGGPGAAGAETPTGALAAARARLAEIDRGLARRGILATDAPALTATRRELAARVARGELPPAAALDARAAQAQAVAVDRGFVGAKLERLGRRMAGRALPADVQERLRRLSQEALSSSLTGRYDQANRELNEIAAIVER
ncbi:MAG TPA: hypothetical protein VGQ83_24610, partial [Polyangia bacterium]